MLLYPLPGHRLVRPRALGQVFPFFVTSAGDIASAAARVMDLANESGETYYLRFNDALVRVEPGMTVREICEEYERQHGR